MVGLSDYRTLDLAAMAGETRPEHVGAWLAYQEQLVQAQLARDAAVESPEARSAEMLARFVEAHQDELADEKLRPWFDAAVNSIASQQPERVTIDGLREALEESLSSLRAHRRIARRSSAPRAPSRRAGGTSLLDASPLDACAHRY